MACVGFLLLLLNGILQKFGDEIGTGLAASAILRLYFPIKFISRLLMLYRCGYRSLAIQRLCPLASGRDSEGKYGRKDCQTAF